MGQACRDDLPDGGRGDIFCRKAGQVLLICPSRCCAARATSRLRLREPRRSFVGWASEAYPPLRAEDKMVGTAQVRLCPPCGLGPIAPRTILNRIACIN